MNSSISYDNKAYLRIPIKTHILTADDDMIKIVQKYTQGILQSRDYIVISESPLAITQGRAIAQEQIKVGLLAKVLWRFVSKVPYGIGLREPTSMQCAIDEVGHLRILFAAVVGGLGKIVGKKGCFYRIAGQQAALIDAANTSPVPPYNKCVIKGPKDPDEIAQQICNICGCETVVMDINDIGGSWVIGRSSSVDPHLLEAVMKDNPQGQADELTPICIVRQTDA